MSLQPRQVHSTLELSLKVSSALLRKISVTLERYPSHCNFVWMFGFSFRNWLLLSLTLLNPRSEIASKKKTHILKFQQDINIWKFGENKILSYLDTTRTLLYNITKFFGWWIGLYFLTQENSRLCSTMTSFSVF